MQHTLEARHGKRNHGGRAARSFFLVATVAISLALPGLARAQAPGEAAAQQPAPETQAIPDAPGTLAPAASPGTLAPAAPAPMQALDVETSAPRPVVIHRAGQLDEKDARFALGGSLVTTGLGVGVMIAGISGDNGALGLVGFTAALLGPSFGHFYAGEYGRGLAHTGLRAGAVVMTVAGAAWTGSLLLGCAFGDESDCNANPVAPLLLVGGGVLGAGAIVYSIHDAPRAAHRYNARTRQLLLTPAPIVGPDHSAGVGLQLGGRF